GPLIFGFGIAPPERLLIYVCQPGVCFGKLWIYFQRFLRRADHFRTRFVGRTADKNCAESPVGDCEADVCRRERRVFLYRLFEISNTLLEACLTGRPSVVA